MAISIWKGGTPDNKSERKAIIELCKILQNSEEWYGLFINFIIPRCGEVDSVVFNERGIYLFEFKEIFGTLEASLNGKWFVRENPRTELLLNKAGKNPYYQTRNYYNYFGKFLLDNQRKYLVPFYKKRFNRRAAIIILGELDSNSNIEKDKNIDVIEFSKLFEWLFTQGKPGLGLNHEEVERIAEILHLEPCKDIIKILKGPKKRFDIEGLKRSLIKEYQSDEPFIMPELYIHPEGKTIIQDLNGLTQISRFVLVGEGGFGKTFLSRQYSLSKLKSGELALIIYLAFYSSQKGITALISETIQEHGLLATEDDVNLILEEENIYLIIDGINEVKKEDRAACIQEIKRINSLYSINQVIVTCRPEYYKNEFKDFSTLRLLPWSKKQIDEYLYLSIRSQEIIEDFKKKSRRQKIDQALLATPIFTKFLCDEFHARKELPSNYRALLKVTVKRWLSEMITDEKSENIALDLPNILSEIAFSLKRNYQFAKEKTEIRQEVFFWFSKKGGEANLGYSASDLWSTINKSYFVRSFSGKVSFIHEIFVDYFTSLKLEQMIINRANSLKELIQDSWWSDCFEYVFYKIDPDIIQNILKIAMTEGNDELLGVALRREVGSNANFIAQSMISELIKSHDQDKREKAVRILKFGEDDPWCIRMLLEVMSKEQEKFIPEGKNESELYLVGGWRSGAEFQAGSALKNLAWFKREKFSRDVIDVILDIEELLPSARTAATELLKGAIGVLPESELLFILKERSCDPAYSVRLESIYIIEAFLNYLMSQQDKNEELYQEIVEILKKLSQDKYLGIYQTAFEVLVRIGEYDISDWSEEQSEKIYREVVSTNNPELVYSIFINRFDDIVGEAHFKAIERLTKTELRRLLRLVTDNILNNRIEIGEAAKRLAESIDIENRVKILDSVPQLNWHSFNWIIDDLGRVATNEDIIRFVKLIENPPKIWERGYIGSALEISWSAAEALVNVGTKKAKKALLDLQINHHPETVVIATLALQLGEDEGKWKNERLVIDRCISSTKNFKSHNFLSLLEKFISKSSDEYFVDRFCKKFGVQKIRQMARDSLNYAPKVSLNFLKKFGNREDIFIVRDIILDPKKSEFHELAKEAIKILSKL